MSPAQPPGLRQVIRDALYRIWSWVLDFALVTWVARAPVALLALGFLILGKAPQAQDLLIPLVGSPWWRLILFFVVVFVFWAMPTHYAARLAVDDDERLDRWCTQRRDQARSTWIEFVMCQGPRLLGALTFVALIICACRARINYPQFPGENVGQRDATFRELNWFMVWCAVFFVLFFVYAVIRQHLIARTRVVGRAERAASRLAPVIDAIDLGRTRSAASLRSGYGGSYLGRTAMFAYFWIFVAVMVLNPLVVADWLPGAWIVAVILGGWLPVLAYLSVIGRRLRAPLIIAVFSGIAVLVAFTGDNHAVRILPEKDSGDGARIALDQALEAWMKANKCSAEAIATCPRPVIVVSAGGASRAGFFAASVIGVLLDDAAKNGLDARTVRNRIFAISGVSGGSLGAVLTVAALARGQDAANQPCPTNKEVPLWYGHKATTWRGCLEASMSGDFLTAGFIGLAFHDRIPLPLFWPDRALLLERSWERYERTVMGDGTRLPCPFDLECPFLSLRGDKFWLPLLVLNGTSISTGRRVVTTSLTPRYKARQEDCPLDFTKDGCRLFAETYDFYDLLNGRRDSGAVTQDVRLSTAVTNSARFPFVSPPGEIFALNSSKLVDRIGDGGYIENFGVLSAYDLVNAIRAVHRELKPFVLVISNDPNLAVDPQDLPTDASGTNILPDITGFLSGIASTRESRASIGLVNLRTLVTRQEGCPVSLAHIRVWPSANVEQSSVISMSWWLSTPVQQRLVSEIDPVSPRNSADLKATWTALSAPHGGCPAQ